MLFYRVNGLVMIKQTDRHIEKETERMGKTERQLKTDRQKATDKGRESDKERQMEREIYSFMSLFPWEIIACFIPLMVCNG